MSSLLTALPESEGHYLKSTKAEVKGSILKSVGWNDKMVADSINFKEKGKKQGIEFSPGSLPILEIFKLSMLSKQFRNQIEILFPQSPYKKHH